MRRDDFDRASQRLFAYTFEVEDRGGYAGTEVDESERRVDLYWKGPLPPSLIELLENVASGCAVRVLPASYDVLEMRSARSRITSAPEFENSGIVTLALSEDGSGLVLGFDSEEPPSRFVEQLELGVPVRWERGSQPQW